MRLDMILLWLLASTLLWAGNTAIWENVDYEDFIKGTLEHTVLHSDGTIHAGDNVEAHKTGELTLWSLIADSSGTVYAGSGVNGVVYRFKDGKLQKYCDTGELIVTSLVISNDVIYAGTLPAGKIFRLHEDKAEKIAELASQYIWDMAIDKQTLWAATGPDGKLYEIDLPSGQKKVLFDSQEKHLLSLAVDKERNIYTGSAPNGILYHVAPNHQVSALVQLPENEIRALALDGQKIYIGANKSDKFDNSRMVQSLAKKVQQQAKGRPLDRKKLLENMVEGVLYSYTHETGWEKLLTIEKNFITSLARQDKDKILLSTGMKGKIYQVQKKEWAVIHDMKEEQIMDMVVADGKLQYFSTGDNGILYQVKPEFFAEKSIYLSDVHDGDTFSHWSALYWDKEGQLIVQVRTGNTRKPDAFWSSWSSSYPSSYPYIKIAGKPGRFFQYRVLWREKDAVLKNVRVLYNRQNRKPEITEFKIDMGNKNPRTIFKEKPVNPIKISWKAKDPDGESLRYRLWCKHENSDFWQELTQGQILTTTSFKWQINDFADGYYRVKLEASDELENSTSCYAQKIFRPILIDNYPPKIRIQTEKDEIAATVIDDSSFVSQIAYRINGGDWKLIDPQDGVCDHLQENFRIKIPAQIKGTMQIRVMDAAGNAGYAFADLSK